MYNWPSSNLFPYILHQESEIADFNVTLMFTLMLTHYIYEQLFGQNKFFCIALLCFRKCSDQDPSMLGAPVMLRIGLVRSIVFVAIYFRLPLT